MSGQKRRVSCQDVEQRLRDGKSPHGEDVQGVRERELASLWLCLLIADSWNYDKIENVIKASLSNRVAASSTCLRELTGS